MYTALLFLHSWLRWLVILTGIAALGGAVAGVTTRRAWLPVDNLRLVLFSTTLDVQMLIGLILYAFLSPVTRSGFENMSLTMRDPILRFFVVEHIAGMIIAIALAHVGRAKVRKATEAMVRHRFALIFVGLSMVALLLSIPWPGMPGGRELFRGLTSTL
jgi:membrane-associated PAP2 superfamily phosphatase